MSHKFEPIGTVQWCPTCGMVKDGETYHIIGGGLMSESMRESRIRTCWMHSNAVLSALYTWIEVRQNLGKGFPSGLLTLRCDLDHSALFRRLLEGKAPLSEPAPRAMSYPWYNLIEDGVGYPSDVWRSTTLEKDEIVIEQLAWKVLETISEEEDHEEWIASYEVPDVKFMQEAAREACMTIEDWCEDQEKESQKQRKSWHPPKTLSDTRWRVKHVGSSVYSYQGKTERLKHNNGKWGKLWVVTRELSLEAPPQSPSFEIQ